MSTEYAIHLRHENCSFRPDLAAIEAYLDALAAGRWIPPKDGPWKPGHSWTAAGPSGARELIFSWTLGDWGGYGGGEGDRTKAAGLRYPYATEKWPEETGYDLQVHRLFNYHDIGCECMEEIDAAVSRCSCGAPLRCTRPRGADRDPDPIGTIVRIHATCPQCGAAFDPSKEPRNYLDGITGEQSIIAGGGAYRFAPMIDFHKMFPSTRTVVEPELRALTERHFGGKFVEFGDIY